MSRTKVNPRTLRLVANAVQEHSIVAAVQLRGAARTIDALNAELAAAQTTAPPARYHRTRMNELAKARTFADSFVESFHRDGRREASEDWGLIFDGLDSVIDAHRRIAEKLERSS